MAIDEPGLPSGGPVRITDLGEITLDQLETGLRDCLGRLDEAGISYVIMGGLAVTTLARPRWTHDVDVFLRPRDAVRALTVLGDAGYEVERTDPEWLFKAWHDGLMIDLIFRSSGHIYLDDEIVEHAIDRTFLGVPMRVISPEDLLVIKAAADGELTHYHWFDALAILARHHLDWEYVLWRSRTQQRRLLSLLVYADALDIDVPSWVIRRLSDRLYADGAPPREELRPTTAAGGGVAGREVTSLEEELRQRLRHHPRTGDLDVSVSLEGGLLVVTGEVETDERRREISEVAAEILPGGDVRNDVVVRQFDGEARVEVVS